MTANLADRDEFSEELHESISLFESAGATPQQINSILLSYRRADPEEPTLFGIGLSRIRGITLDGLYWLEVYGPSLTRDVMPSGGYVYSFRVARAPGGKSAKYGIAQGTFVVTTEARIVGVTVTPERA